MARKPAKDETLDAIDFIVNVLKEHENDLDRLITELSTVLSGFGETGELSGKIEKVEERLSSIQTKIGGVMKFISSTGQPPANFRGPPVIIRCRQWNDFKVLAKGAQTVSFIFKDEEKAFQADAFKEGRILTYTGEFPRDTRLLKLWLSQELDVTEETVFEGVLATG